MAVCGEGDPTESGRLRLEAVRDVAGQNQSWEPVLSLRQKCQWWESRPNCETGIATIPEGSGDTPVLIMKTAKVREGDNLSSLPALDEARLRALLVQGGMGACRVVVREVGAQEPFEMAVVVDDDVIEALSPNRADQALDVGILPG